MIDLRRLASIARSSELHDLKVGLTPDEADSIADEIERLTTYWRNRYNDLTDSITAALDGRPVDTSDFRDYPLSVGAKKTIERVQAGTTERSELERKAFFAGASAGYSRALTGSELMPSEKEAYFHTWKRVSGREGSDNGN